MATLGRQPKKAKRADFDLSDLNDYMHHLDRKVDTEIKATQNLLAAAVDQSSAASFNQSQSITSSQSSGQTISGSGVSSYGYTTSTFDPNWFVSPDTYSTYQPGPDVSSLLTAIQMQIDALRAAVEMMRQELHDRLGSLELQELQNIYAELNESQ